MPDGRSQSGFGARAGTAFIQGRGASFLLHWRSLGLFKRGRGRQQEAGPLEGVQGWHAGAFLA